MGAGMEQTIVRTAAPARDRGIVAKALATLPDAQRAMAAWPSAASSGDDDAAPAAYTPRAGSTPARVIAHLRSNALVGEEVSTAALAASMGIPDPSSMWQALQPAVRAGLIFCRKKGGHPKSPLFWSLVDHSKTNGSAPAASPAGDGSQTPNGGRVDRPVKAGSDYSEGRDSQQVLKAEPATADATDRETPAMASPRVGATGTGQPADAGPAGDLPPELVAQLSKSTRRRLDAVVPGAHALAKRAAARAEQGATAPAETGSLRIALWSDGELQIRRPGGHAVVFTREETRQIVAYLDSIALDAVREGDAC